MEDGRGRRTEEEEEEEEGRRWFEEEQQWSESLGLAVERRRERSLRKTGAVSVRYRPQQPNVVEDHIPAPPVGDDVDVAGERTAGAVDESLSNDCSCWPAKGRDRRTRAGRRGGGAGLRRHDHMDDVRWERLARRESVD